MQATIIDNWLKNSPVLQGLSPEVVDEIRGFSENQLNRIQELAKIGMALSAEKQLDRLLEMIVSEARHFTHADGGALYIKTDDENLEFKIIQNDSLGIRMGGTGEHISWPPVPLKGPDGIENHRNVSAHCALEGEHVNIDDVYDADFDFQGTKDFDATTGYRSKSMLLIPMRDHEDEVIGVLQLLNAQNRITNEVIGFDDHEIADITSLASQAAIAITNVKLVGKLENHLGRIQELVKIGMALSAEKQLDRLLEMIVSEARRFTHADGGALYIKTDDENLEFKIIQNDSLNIRMGGTGEQISWPPVPLKVSEGVENHRNVSAHCALKGKPVNIDDVYDADFDFQGTKDFDAKTGYRSKSMLLIPMRDHEDEVIGVLQLLNAQNSVTGEVIGFDKHEIADIMSLASQAAIAITNVRLVGELENLLNSFLRAIAAAIDEKSPYTAGHVSRVANLTSLIAIEINKNENGRFGNTSFSYDELSELKMAAWMHDVGKVTTPEYVVNKSTKLETIFDRIKLVEARIQILKREVEIRKLKEQLARHEGVYERPHEDLERFDELLKFLSEVNVGGEFLGDDKVEKIKTLAGYEYGEKEKKEPLLTDEEIENLSIRKGTLNTSERSIINNHVNLTIKMLEKLPFPKKLEKVPDYAGMHHEKLDGSGYPLGLKGDEIPVQSRILAVADVFEALTAADRPYKPGKKLSESMKILEFMVKDKHLDEEICDLMVQSGLVQYYGCRNLSERQRDDFDWKGEKISVNCSQENQECV